jgi:acetyltransferase-like isoleucine patch superfamily enzyme
LYNSFLPIDAVKRHEVFVEHFTIGMQFHDLKSREITIEDDVWIGFNSTIMKGVKIGRGAIIGANSIVTHNFETWTVNAGNPFKMIRKLKSVD